MLTGVCKSANEEQRDQETLAEPDRLCDYQAMLLIEVHSQYRARRAARVLSSRFAKIYHKVRPYATRGDKVANTSRLRTNPGARHRT